MSAANLPGWTGAANAIIAGDRDEQLVAAAELCSLYDEATMRHELAWDLSHVRSGAHEWDPHA